MDKAIVIDMPKNVKDIIEKIEQAGYEAFAVGGCIRDMILGRTPNDWDITTSAKPQDVKRLFRRTVDTGIQHGTVTVLIGDDGYEVTTYRIDGVYEDARHPKEVSFTDNLIEDLKRRDFTINALAYNDSRGLVDAFDGIGDMERGIVKCVGNPYERFSEDALRMMRAVRFAAQLGFEIDHETQKAAEELAENLQKISAERIMTELTKLITSDNPDMIRTAYNMGLTRYFLPEFDLCMETTQNTPYHCYDVGEHIIHTLKAIDNDRTLRFTMLLHDIAKPEVKTVDEKGITHNFGHAELGAEKSKTILRRLRSDNELIHAVSVLIFYHDWRFKADKVSVRKAINKVGEDLFPLLLKVQRADAAGQSDYLRDEKEKRFEEIEILYKQILDDGEAVSLKDLAVCGKDLVDVGIKEGPLIGGILKSMLEHVLEHPQDNNREVLLQKFLDTQV